MNGCAFGGVFTTKGPAGQQGRIPLARWNAHERESSNRLPCFGMEATHMINIQWRCLLLLVLSASAAHAQQWPANYANPYYPQVPAQRYYYPNPNGYYPGNAAPGATYY